MLNTLHIILKEIIDTFIWYTVYRVQAIPLSRKETQNILEVISKLGFWSHIKAAAKFKPEEYVGISRT